MKRILCYGDSNTWGYIAGSGKRYPHDVRWTGVVQRELGEGYQVLEEGLVGRTTVFDNPFAPWRNGIDYLMPCLITHKPIALIIVMLGSNDLRWTTAFGSSEGARRIVGQIKLSAHMEGNSIFTDKPEILVVAPIHAHENLKYMVDEFKQLYPERSLRFAEHYARMAKETGCAFLDAALYVEPSEIDGLHMTQESHERLGLAIAQKVKDLLEE